MHPLADVFQKRKAPQKRETFIPLPVDVIVKETPSSVAFQKMGCLVLAGGQGTRLGVEGPKGCVELPLKEKKTLFQLIFEKIKTKGKDLPLAIMTSPLNHEATVEYLEKHHYFGLTHVSIFSQDMIAVCDDEGRVCGEMKSPDGNGKALKNLYTSGVWGNMEKARCGNCSSDSCR